MAKALSLDECEMNTPAILKVLHYTAYLRLGCESIGPTAHPVRPDIMVAAHALHYAIGVSVREIPANPQAFRVRQALP